MSKKDFEAIALVIDCGLSSIENRSEFLEKCKECATNIILKKMFSESKDVLSVIAFGSDTTNNPLADEDQYRNVDVVLPFMSGSWDLVTAVSQLSPTLVKRSDWCDAMVVGMHCLKEKMDDTKQLKKANHITTTKLVVFSTFNQDVDDSCMDSVVAALLDQDIEAIFIAPDDLAHKIEDDHTGKTLSDGEIILKKIIDKCGTLVAVSEATAKLSKFSRKKTGRQRWKSSLAIGSKISIPINGYKIMNEPYLKKEKRCIDDNALVRADYSYVHGADEVQREDIIHGYVYADVIVPMSKLDTDAMSYSPGPKGMAILGFVKRSSIKPQYWTGKSAFYVVGDLDDTNAQSAMAALVRALSDMKMVAIARKVYSENRGLKVGALYPKVDVNPPALIFIDLPYSNEIRALQFPSLKKTKVTAEQYSIIDQLIDCMDSSNRDEDEEDPYDFSSLVDIKEQYFLHCLAKKGASGSDGKVDLQMPEFLQEMLKPDDRAQQRSKAVLDELRTLFPLKAIVKRGKALINEANNVDAAPVTVKSEPTDVSMEEVGDLFQTPISAVGSVNPIEDFRILLKKPNIDFETLCDQMQTIIQELVVRAGSDSEMLVKPLGALKCLRDTCLEQKRTADFNTWLHKLKETAVANQLTEFWRVLVKDNLGLITRDEMPYSFYSKEEGDEFLDFSAKVQKTDGSDGEIDYDAMLMDM